MHDNANALSSHLEFLYLQIAAEQMFDSVVKNFELFVQSNINQGFGSNSLGVKIFQIPASSYQSNPNKMGALK